MLKISLLFKKKQTLRVNNSRIVTIKIVKLSRYYFYMNLNMRGDFQIRISVLFKKNLFLDIKFLQSF